MIFSTAFPNWPPGHLATCYHALMAGCILIFLEAFLVPSSAALQSLPRAFCLLYVLFRLPSHPSSFLTFGLPP
jgi:hypothetical protein